MPKKLEQTLEALEEVFNLEPSSIADAHDTLRLMGVVLSYLALLEVVSDSRAKASDKIAAAKILVDLKESPQHISERLRGSIFADLSLEELKEVVQSLASGRFSVAEAIRKIKEKKEDDR